MKNRYLYITILFILLGVTSCDKQLDLAPKDVYTEEVVFAKAETAEMAMADVYYKFFEVASGATHMIADVSLPCVSINESSNYTTYTEETLNAEGGEVANIWIGYFEDINVANVFIDKVPEYGKYDETLELQHIAEAKFVRAYCYLGLLSFYGDGALTANSEGLCVPLKLTPYDGFNGAIPRNTNAEVYAQIITDLSEAIIDLPENYENSLKTRSRATKAAAYALLSRVYLYQKDYESCISAANMVLQNASYDLEPELLNLFPLNMDGTTSYFSDEVIFGLPVSGNGGNYQYAQNNIIYYNKSELWVSDEFVNSMQETDKRRTDLIFEGNEAEVGKVTTYKFNNPSHRDDIPMIRLAEIILNKAEALAQLNGTDAQAITLLNKIKKRSGLTQVNKDQFASKDALLEEIYNERYFETAFEGRARFDFIRTGRPLRNVDLPDGYKVFPIPQREIDLSKGILVQNPQYIK
nr:RagB/SusD family nutrient uptake outer membrane protein [uncultured Draconibacterium sp.]